MHYHGMLQLHLKTFRVENQIQISYFLRKRFVMLIQEHCEFYNINLDQTILLGLNYLPKNASVGRVLNNVQVFKELNLTDMEI